MKFSLLKTIIFILIVIVNAKAQRPIPANAQTKSILLLGATAHIGDGKVIENSAIGFKNGIITFVGTATDANKSLFDEVINVSGKHVYPGLIAANITLGLVEVGAVRSTRDMSEVGINNPHVRSLIAYNTDSKIIPTTRTNGILLAQITPRDGVFSGTSSIMNLDGWNWEDAVNKADDGVHLNWPGMFKRSGWWAEPGPTEKNKEYEIQVNEIKKFLSDAKAYNETPEKSEKNLRFESMKGLFNGTQQLYVHCNFAKEIMEAITICKEIGVKKIVLVGGKDSWMITDFIKKHNIPVIVSRVHELPERNDDDIDITFKLPYLLHKAGILFCLTNEGDMEAMGTRNLPFMAGTAAAYGLTKEEALAAISGNTAKILGIDNVVGTITIGKQATLFVSSGDALDMRTNNVEQAYILGKTIDLNNEQKFLYETYKKKYDVK